MQLDSCQTFVLVEEFKVLQIAKQMSRFHLIRRFITETPLPKRKIKTNTELCPELVQSTSLPTYFCYINFSYHPALNVTPLNGLIPVAFLLKTYVQCDAPHAFNSTSLLFLLVTDVTQRTVGEYYRS